MSTFIFEGAQSVAEGKLEESIDKFQTFFEGLTRSINILGLYEKNVDEVYDLIGKLVENSHQLSLAILEREGLQANAIVVEVLQRSKTIVSGEIRRVNKTQT